VTAVVGGLIAALAWGSATIASAQASRDAGPFVAFACANVVALAITLPIALASGSPTGAPAAAWGWAVVYGFGLIGAFGFAFPALTIGRVGIVAPVIATDGAIAALFAILTGESVASLAAAGLVLVVGGVVLSVLQPAPAESAGPRRDRLAALLGLASAACFATAFIAASKTDGLDAAWVVAVGRAVNVVFVTIPIVAHTGLPRLSRRTWLLIAGEAIGDVVGNVAFVAATRDGLAVPAVLGSQYAIVAALLGVFFFRERLTPLQWGGVALTLTGVAIVAAVGA
jgi:drug/metabolite transporter (DMT)-like permease